MVSGTKKLHSSVWNRNNARSDGKWIPMFRQDSATDRQTSSGCSNLRFSGCSYHISGLRLACTSGKAPRSTPLGIGRLLKKHIPHGIQGSFFFNLLYFPSIYALCDGQVVDHVFVCPAHKSYILTGNRANVVQVTTFAL